LRASLALLAATAFVALATAGGSAASTPTSATKQPNRDAETARRNVDNAIVAIEAWNADHGTYVGATVRKLRAAYHAPLANVTIVSASRTSYCVESTVGKATMRKAGPAAPVAPGRCRR